MIAHIDSLDLAYGAVNVLMWAIFAALFVLTVWFVYEVAVKPRGQRTADDVEPYRCRSCSVSVPLFDFEEAD